MTHLMRAAGFTLIEILASLLLFSLGTLAVVGVIMHGMNNAVIAQADASAWMTAFTVLKDPKPLGVTADSGGLLKEWTWSRSGTTWTADDGSGIPVWLYTAPDFASSSDALVPDMADPICNNPAVFSAGSTPSPGCARGWLNGYYVERREQSRAADRITTSQRIVEVRVDVYWAKYGATDGKPLATLCDRIVRAEGL
jgi:prepilin-type N-terminal cleavage/methylation domain-containing protein